MLRNPIRAKRGSLSLSINAIVIIVLAMTLLGLGLGFIRGLFKNITETTTTVTEQVRQQILEDLKTGDKKLAFSANSIQMESSSSQTVTIGVRNSKNTGDLNFIVYVEALQATMPNKDKFVCARESPSAGVNPTEDPGYACTRNGEDADAEGNVIMNQYIDFFYDKGPYTLNIDNAEVYPIRITAQSGSKGTYLVKISILENANDDEIYGQKPSASDDPTPNEVYAEKTFFITVT
ncbi:MAG TPA: hypothetical protein VJK52_03675 [Candidatus Nanoarchaeia archaeon]|nr:hypothetical protein [Candidatus Nanoarchaeia archaeon]